MRAWCVQLVALALLTSRGWCQEIVSFTRVPEGVAPPSTSLQFQCVGGGGTLSWEVGSSGRFSSSTGAFTVHRSIIDQDQENSTLTFRGKEGDNDTTVTCYVSSSTKTVNVSSLIIIAAAPLPPAIEVRLVTGGDALEAVWYRPFTHAGFPITSYTLTVTNKTSGLPAGKEVVVTGLDNDMQIYELRRPVTIYSACHSLVFSVIAANSVGDSITGDTAISGFPVFPMTSNVVLYMTARATMNNDTELIGSFQSPTVCEYQTPPTFLINIYSSSRSLIRTSGTQSIDLSQSTIEHSLVLPGLRHGNSLSAELIISHPTVAGQVYFTYLGIDLPFDQDISIGGLGGGAQLPTYCSPVLFIIVITLSICMLH